ncbi:hypothetical protein SAMN02800694_1071 [Luteibacter sp. UNCMF331Sha3.1]|uniref:hypothetical protein n=1 Tax=Luteibacter sp. UNCMF331Sha3.1 TaxID=1502760 RepID=UPI0008C4DAB7|nr:hypothetical protein [Luteibacter sp. UNCMF331Sha3.1]SEM43447.1 hypothetical protein SAMN02800694_1071 [Luteibacter sp. UNCMF331Sha3.1]
MHRHAFIAIVGAFAPTAPIAQTAVECFDHLPPVTIGIGQPLELDRFRIEVPFGGRSAAIRAAPIVDDIASGMVLGMPHGEPSSTVVLTFASPWQRVDIDVVLPPTIATPSPETVVLTYAEGDEHASALGLRHSATGLRQHIALGTPQGRPIRQITVLLRDGAYLDNVGMR